MGARRVASPVRRARVRHDQGACRACVSTKDLNAGARRRGGESDGDGDGDGDGDSDGDRRQRRRWRPANARSSSAPLRLLLGLGTDSTAPSHDPFGRDSCTDSASTCNG